MIKAVIFDMDGTLIHSEPIYYKSIKKKLEEYGIKDFTEEDFKKCIGISSRIILEDMRNKHKEFNIEMEEFLDWEKYFYEYLKDIKEPMEGVIETLDYFKERNYKLAVASSSYKTRVENVLRHLMIYDYFQEIVSRGKEERAKPFPDLFIKTAKLLDVKPDECLVFEDSEAGVKAAKAAGMKVVAVPHEYTKHMEFKEADLVLNSMKEFDYGFLKN